MLYYNKINFLKTNKKIYIAREYNDAKIDEDKNNKKNSIQTEVINKRAAYLENARSQCWEEAILTEYSTFEDYTTLVIQLGKFLF